MTKYTDQLLCINGQAKANLKILRQGGPCFVKKDKITKKNYPKSAFHLYELTDACYTQASLKSVILQKKTVGSNLRFPFISFLKLFYYRLRLFISVTSYTEDETNWRMPEYRYL